LQFLGVKAEQSHQVVVDHHSANLSDSDVALLDFARRLASAGASFTDIDVEALRIPAITFWTAWSGDELHGCGALKALAPDHGEIKSMRTANAHRRKGVARAMLQHIVAEARRRSYARLSLETGSMPAFAPARTLYESFGFTYCAAFADYRDDPNSVFMTRSLDVIRRASSSRRRI